MNQRSTLPTRRVTIHGQQITEQDWRGILAIITTVGYFLIVGIASSRFEFIETLLTLALLSTPEMLVLNWYFRAKEGQK